MDESAVYEIRVAEQLSPAMTEWFDGMEIDYSAETSQTILRGRMADQPALYGAIGKLRDLGLT